MVKVEYTIKLKDNINAPEFKEGMGKGVVSKVTIEYKDVDDEEFKTNPSIQNGIIEQMDKFILEHFEVIPKIIK